MKHFTFILAGLLFIAKMDAQISKKQIKKHHRIIEKSRIDNSAILSLDTVFFKGKPLCLSQRMGNTQDYSIKSLVNNKELMILSNVDINKKGSIISNFVDVSFLEANEKVRLYWSDKVYTVVANYYLINDSGINKENLNKFLLVKGKPPLNNAIPAPDLPTNHPHLISLNSTVKPTNSDVAFQISGSNVLKNGVIIATISNEIVLDKNQYIIKRQTGEIVAKVHKDDTGNNNWIAVTSRDYLSHMMGMETNLDSGKLIQFLIEKGYL